MTFLDDIENMIKLLGRLPASVIGSFWCIGGIHIVRICTRIRVFDIDVSLKFSKHVFTAYVSRVLALPVLRFVGPLLNLKSILSFSMTTVYITWLARNRRNLMWAAHNGGNSITWRGVESPSTSMAITEKEGTHQTPQLWSRPTLRNNYLPLVVRISD